MDNSECEILQEIPIKNDATFKVVLIGAASVGKSCIFLRIGKNEFKEVYNVTIGTDMCTVPLGFKGKNIELQVWDTAGMEQFRSMIHVFFNGAHCVILVYDITRKESFDALDSWLQSAQETAPSGVKLVLLGNKQDDEENRQVSKDIGQEYASKNGILDFFETSAKSGYGIKEVVKKIAKDLYLDTQGTQTTTGQRLNPKSESKSSCC